MSRHDSPAFSVSAGGGTSSFGADGRPARAAELRGVFSDYSLTTWGPAEGLAASAIWAIVQTEEGYLWLGTGRRPDSIRRRPVRFLGGARLAAAAGRSPFARCPAPGMEASGSGSARRAAWSACSRESSAATALRRGWRKAPSRRSSSIPTARSGREPNAACTAWSTIAGNGSTMACPRRGLYRVCGQERELPGGHGARNVPSTSGREQVRADRRLFRNRAGHQRGRLRHSLGERSVCGFSQAPRTPDARPFH